MKEARRMEDVEMKPRLRVALQVWLDGTDLAAMLPKATFYRYRRELLDQAGIDISMSAAAQVEADSSALLGIEELQAREVVKIPERIQRSLFVAGL
jgi:hypothetical protein